MVINLLTWPVAHLPNSWGLRLGAGLGGLIFRVWERRRRVAVGNIEMIKATGALPADLDSVATARAAFTNMGRSGWEAICCYHRGLGPLQDNCHVEAGQEYMESALAESKRTGLGIMLITAHLGSWEIMCHYCARIFNLSLTIIGRNTGQPLADALIERLRTSTGDKYVAKRGAAKAIFACLRSGGILGVVLDQAALGRPPSPRIPFLGKDASINVVPLKLARRVGAQVLVILTHREGSQNYLSCYPAFTISTDIEEEQAVLDAARQINSIVGEYIKRYPDQWMWGHRRWKTSEGNRKDSNSLT